MRRSATTVGISFGANETLVIEPSTGRLRIGMAMGGIDHLVDVSAHPAAAVVAVHHGAMACGMRRGDAEVSARGALDRAAASADAWQAPADAPLVAALGGAAFPILAATYAAGAAPLGEIPRWAVPTLVAPTARAAASAAFDTQATRPVVAALAVSLRGSDEAAVDLTNLAMALMGLRVLEPDHLVRVLAAGPVVGVQRAPPSGADILAARPVIERWGARRASRILIEAAEHPRGLALLTDTVRHARTLGDHGPRRLPNRLAELHDAHRVLVRTDPGPPPRTNPTERPTPAVHRLPPLSARPAPPEPRLDDRDAALYAPTGFPAVAPTDVLTVRSAVAGLDDTTIGDLRIVVPRTVADLLRWSRLLRNCLGDFGPAAVAGHSTLLGIERAGSLRYALELRPSAVIRQFLGAANRPPSATDRSSVVRFLADRCILDRGHAANQRWLSGR